MDSFRITKLANKFTKSFKKKDRWVFTHLLLLDFADAIIRDYAKIDLEIMKDMFRERDEEIKRLQEEIESLKTAYGIQKSDVY